MTINEQMPPTMRPYSRHILICENGDCADPEDATRLQQRFRTLAQAYGLNKLRNPQRVNARSPAAWVCAAAGRSWWCIRMASGITMSMRPR